jgi:uncharacterized protein
MDKNDGRQIFVNLAVRDLQKSKAFFSKLGFQFDPKWTRRPLAWSSTIGRS